jgi:hypothetical protein
MDAECKSLCDAMARSIVARDFDGAHAPLAPWLRSSVIPSEIQRMLDAQNEGLTHPPHSWTVGEGVVDLDELRRPDPYGPPSSALPDQITPANFKGWLHIQFAPEPSVHEEQNVCYDVWLVAVEHEGSCLASYFEAWEAT